MTPYAAPGSTAGGTQAQNHSYTHDGLGNLTSRSRQGTSTENFLYDNLNRLWKRDGTVIATYDSNGNITSKLGIRIAASGAYGYGSARPHAVTSAFGYTIGYDANGNVDSRTGNGETWDFKWTGFDKPRWMAKDDVGSEFLYGADRQRIAHYQFDAMSGGAPSNYTHKKLYLGASMEVDYRQKNPGESLTMARVRIYIAGPDGKAGAVEFAAQATAASDHKALVYHTDHLGSIDLITAYDDSTGNASKDWHEPTGRDASYSYNAWGERRDPTDLTGAPSSTSHGGDDDLTPRGYTGHEMLDGLDLVHMNGRIYDPLLGRFLSADPFIQAPGNLQSYNRYSYVMNSPLGYVDPSGYTAEEQHYNQKPLSQRIMDQMNAGNGGAFSGTIFSDSDAASTQASAAGAGAGGAPAQRRVESQGQQAQKSGNGNANTNVSQNAPTTEANEQNQQAPNNAGNGLSPLTNAKLAAGFYDPNFTGVDGVNIVPGTIVDDKKTGLRTAVFSDGTNNVQVFAGTSPGSWANWRANLKQAFGFKSAQYEQGIQEANDNSKLYENLSFLGHSLGGGIASASAIVTGGRAVTFNAAGIHNKTIGDFSRSNGTITSYHSTFDVLRIGNFLSPASVPRTRMSLGSAGFHRMKGVIKALEN